MAENYFRLTSLEDGNQISIKAVGSPTAVNLQYRTSIDQTWQAYAIGTLISLSTNEWIEFRNDTGTFSSNKSDYYNVTMTKAAVALGSIMSLLDYNNMDMAVPGWAFYGLFMNCSKLREPPALPATTLGESCYWVMFQGCTSLTEAPALPATTLARNCYHNMFQDCKSLTTPPELPATNLATGCYDSMFKGCTSLTSAPALPATTITPSCYNSMFNGCTSLTSAPALPALKMTDYCYSYMFNGCTSLTTPPELPATTLASKCYWYMFNGCKNLRTAPELLATTLAEACYQYMFQGCTSLTTAPELPATTLAIYCYYSMFQNCTSLTTPPELPATTLAARCYYSMFTGCKSLTQAPALPATTLAEYCYYQMFQNCTSLTIAPSVLPATTLADNCYSYMFNGCTSLTTAPELPATTLANNCYQQMFSFCKTLTKAPALPATKLSTSCYSSMFKSCTSLTSAPLLPASSLAQYCYAYMFQDCTTLTEAPDMYATNLANYCCQQMFNGCTNLNHIIWRSKTVPSVSFCNSWLVNASTSGTFEYTNPLLDVASISRNVSGVPEGWNIQQLKPQAGGISLKINNVDVKKAMLSGKNIAKLFINGVKVKSSTPIGTDIELPSHLTKLLYVDSNGGTIDTGIPTNGNLKVGIKWSKTKTGNSQWPEMFGNIAIPGTPGEYYQAFSFRCNTASGHYDYYHGLYSATNPRYGGRIDIAESSTTLGDTVHEYWMDPTRFSFDGQIFNTVDYANTHDKTTDWEYQPERLNSQTMVLFSSRTGNREAIINCYNFYIVDTSTNTVLVNYVPCKQGTQAGFYDTVSQTFVTNSKFLAGTEA